jgi:hypothetical protein
MVKDRFLDTPIKLGAFKDGVADDLSKYLGDE